uniref:Uncharacterized protein n=1 Tax=Glossina palpalis gambiensis TaxID=67801 RepID=A0A1B0BTF2_9MUSC
MSKKLLTKQQQQQQQQQQYNSGSSNLTATAALTMSRFNYIVATKEQVSVISKSSAPEMQTEPTDRSGIQLEQVIELSLKSSIKLWKNVVYLLKPYKRKQHNVISHHYVSNIMIRDTHHVQNFTARALLSSCMNTSLR